MKHLLKIITRFGFFRLTLIPLGIIIIISALLHEIIGMGIVGFIVIVFGVLNKCLLLGQCESDIEKNK